ncbi:MAG TPA: ATP-dependent protease LonB [Candidatus Thermoplasmatota archaeon]|nr:ATP-dependent protease LonB [Candidatus Thermoplasmatota archaeon]
MSPPLTSTTAKHTLHPDPSVWIQGLGLKSTDDVQVPTRLIDQVIGQDKAVSVALKAAEQKRNLLLIGDPGTGKSMIAKAMAEVLPFESGEDTIAYHNPKNPNEPRIKVLEGGVGRQLVEKYEAKAKVTVRNHRVLQYGIAFLTIATGVWATFFLTPPPLNTTTFVFVVMGALIYAYLMSQKKPKAEQLVPKLLVERGAEVKQAPYVEGTGSQAGALLGDVRHDPFQSGGLETPAHVRVEAGAIHRAHKGVLFIDEINVLRLASQQALLTGMQEKKYAISGQSQTSSGANVRTEPVPCDFILVAAGNQDALAPPDGMDKGMHPALRSRIRGYGYEVFVNSIMEDTHANRVKLVQFVAQEVKRDGKCPPFEPAAIAEILREAQRRSGRSGKLTLRLRELGGLVRTAGDFANTAGAKIVTVTHVRAAKDAARSMEQQMTDAEIQTHLADSQLHNSGSAVGAANGVAVIGTGEVGEPAALVTAVEAAVVPALSRHAGSIVLGQGLKDHLNHGVENVGAVLKTLKGSNIADHDLHIDAHFGHPQAEAEGIGLAAAVAAVSALEGVPVHQDIVLIGSLAINGEARPVRATLQRIEAAAASGYHRALVPSSLQGNLVLEPGTLEAIQVVYCATLADVLAEALDCPPARRDDLVSRLRSNASWGRPRPLVARARRA